MVRSEIIVVDLLGCADLRGKDVVTKKHKSVGPSRLAYVPRLPRDSNAQ